MHGQAQMRTKLAIGMVSSLLALTGCVSYTNVSGPESPPAFRSPNHYAAVDVTGTALDYVLARHGVSDGAGYVVNLPAGTSQENAMKIFSKLPSGAVWPSSEEQDPSRMYHVGRVWIRASEAKVDVVYPFTMINGGTGQRGMTVWLQGGVRDWRVIRGQYWAPGTVEVPAVSVPVLEEEGFFEQWSDSDDEPARESPEETSRNDETPMESPASEPSAASEMEIESEPAAQPSTGDGSSLWREIPVEDS